MTKSKTAPLGGSYGEMDLLEAKDMTVLHHIQRRPSDSRLRQLQPWKPEKEGLIFVAKITDGVHAGTLHPYDGGTRVVSQQTYGDPHHVFLCWVKEMTEQEAAEAFLTFNMDGRRPSAYSQYMVALEAGQEWALVIDGALTSLGVTVAESPTSTKLSAVRACQRIVERLLPDSHLAETHLGDVLAVSMAAYPGSPEAYDADLIQAVSRILLDNAMVVDRTRLVDRIARKSMGHWRAAASARRDAGAVTSGGSESRSNTLRYELIEVYNNRLGDPRKLRM